jgi:type IV pilus assembly protein PilQ
VAWTRSGPGRFSALIVAGWLGAGIIACATAQTQEEPEAGPAAQTEVGGGVLSGVWAERDGEGSMIMLEGLADPVYTAFLHSDPPALVLDLASVEVADPGPPLVVYDGLVEQVSVSSFESGENDPTTRVEISLSAPAEYEIEPSGDGLALHLHASSAPADEAADDVDETVVESWSGPLPEDVASQEEMTPAETPPPPATALSAIQVSETSEGVLLHLEADGVIGATESFTLEDPARLVVDLPGLTSNMTASKIEVGSPMVSRVRIGSHPGKIRVVIDGGEGAGSFEGRRIMPAADGLFVTMGGGEDLDEALAMGIAGAGEQHEPELASIDDQPAETVFDEDATLAEAEVPWSGAETTPEQEAMSAAEAEEALPAAESDVEEEQSLLAESEQAPTDTESSYSHDAGSTPISEVHGIHFDSQPDRDRIVVLSEGLVEYEVHTPNEETVVLSIPGSTIQPGVEGRIVPQPGGPLSLITLFEQPEIEGGEVRVVMRRAPNLEPEISRHGSLLFIEFQNTGVAAAAPPAFENLSDDESSATPAEQAAEPGAESATLASAEEPEVLEGVAEPEMDVRYTELPQFSEPASFTPTEEFDDAMVPASIAPDASDGSSPASLEPPAAVEILQEGGLIDGKEYQGRRISLDFKDVQVADVLRIIAEVSDLNIVAGEEVNGQVTIRLVDVPWDQALDVILLTKGLGFVRIGNVLRIAPADILQQEEEVRLQERRNKEKLEDLVVKLHPVNYASVKDIATLVKRLLSARGSVNVDERTNTLIIKDIASVIDEATALVKAIDTQTPQVMIEAKIVEANLDFSRELGSRWSFGTQPLQDPFTGNQDQKDDLGDEDFLFHDSNNVNFFNPITSIPTGWAVLNAFILDQQLNLGVVLEAAESTGDGKVISSPRVVTLDNREAEIQQGVSIPFQTFENGDAKLEFIDAVLRLLVTPHITSDKSIIMQIEVERNAPDDSVQTPTGSPAIAKNEAKTETLVQDGQTLVIGGIYTVVKSHRESRVPYLHSIPVIGAAFKNKEVTDQRKELLIFVTPRVVVQPTG